MLPKAIILDFDDTLNKSNGPVNTHDPSHISGLAINEGTHELIEGFVRGSKHDVFVLIVTARREMCIQAIIDWLYVNYPCLSALRKEVLTLDATELSGQPPAVKKEKIYLTAVQGKYDILFALDDCKDCVTMYRKYGVYTLELENKHYGK